MRGDIESIISEIMKAYSPIYVMFDNYEKIFNYFDDCILIIDASQMTETQLHAKLQRGYDDYQAGRTQTATDAFAKFRESHS